MVEIQRIKIEDYSYSLPDERIAKYPTTERSGSNLLVFDGKNISKDKFTHINNYLEEDSLLIFNNTKVINARLEFFKSTGAKIEIFCLEPFLPKEYNQNFQQTKSCTWACLVGNKKKWKGEELKKTIFINELKTELSAFLENQTADKNIIRFTWDNPEVTFSMILENIGNTPIPPYLKRKSEDIDRTRYQTIYSKIEGSVAAPTAGLHFTPEILAKVKQKNITLDEVTLHVGAGTFQPVKSEYISNHPMHTEHFEINKNTLNNLIKHLGNITAVGTTTVRNLESLYIIGKQLIEKKENPYFVEQWSPYKTEKIYSASESIQAIIDDMEIKQTDIISASTQIIIAPGYEFKFVNSLITNFHQPKSTLLLLIAAFVGDNWMEIYNFALNNNFRFLSYGDSSILKEHKKRNP